MLPQHHSQATQPTPPTDCNLTLQPLQTDGPDSLDTHDVPGLAKVTLCEVEILSRNPAHGITVRKAKDLFAPGAPSPLPQTSTATLASATLFVVLPNVQRPHKVFIRPPHELKLECAADAPLLIPWLRKRHFCAKILANAAALILVALASALPTPTSELNQEQDDESPPGCAQRHR